MNTPEKVRENRVRRAVDRRGYRLVKSRRRDPMAVDYGLYRVEDEWGNEAPGFRSDMNRGLALDEVEKRLGTYRARPRRRPPLAAKVSHRDDPAREVPFSSAGRQ